MTNDNRILTHHFKKIHRSYERPKSDRQTWSWYLFLHRFREKRKVPDEEISLSHFSNHMGCEEWTLIFEVHSDDDLLIAAIRQNHS